jgi:hypothetical protein
MPTIGPGLRMSFVPCELTCPLDDKRPFHNPAGTMVYSQEPDHLEVYIELVVLL